MSICRWISRLFSYLFGDSESPPLWSLQDDGVPTDEMYPPYPAQGAQGGSD